MNKRRHNQDAWQKAKSMCRLNTRQIEMARALGMNPKKLPSLRPGPQQRWMLPVGTFIEELYRKRFGNDASSKKRDSPVGGRGSPEVSRADRDSHVPERVTDPGMQVSDPVCRLMNLADDLQKWLAHGTIESTVLVEVKQELRDILYELETGEPISSVPSISVPAASPRHSRKDRSEREPIFDDEIPF